MAITPQEKLEKLKAQREALDARIRREAAKAGAEGRKHRNRQKYIVGGIVLAALRDNNLLSTQLLAVIKANASESDLEVLADALPKQQAAQPTPQPPLSKGAIFDAVKSKFGSA